MTTALIEKMKEEKEACSDPEAGPLFCKLLWLANWTDTPAEVLLSGAATERFQEVAVEVSRNLSAEIRARPASISGSII